MNEFGGRDNVSDSCGSKCTGDSVPASDTPLASRHVACVSVISVIRCVSRHVAACWFRHLSLCLEMFI